MGSIWELLLILQVPKKKPLQIMSARAVTHAAGGGLTGRCCGQNGMSSSISSKPLAGRVGAGAGAGRGAGALGRAAGAGRE